MGSHLRTLFYLKLLDLNILLKQQAKQNKMAFQGYHTSCEEAKNLGSTDTNR